MIIDMHAHLGDICFEAGGRLIERTGVRKQRTLDVVSVSERLDHPFTDGIKFGSFTHRLDVKASMACNRAGTSENFIRSMDRAGIDLSVALPVPPNVTFAELLAAARKDPRVIPFTGVDFTRDYDFSSALAADVAAGARGMKLHPILQREKLNSEKTFAAVAAFAAHDLPVLIHTGVCYYYPDPRDQWREKPEFGQLEDVKELVQAFPRTKFILGHAGLTRAKEAMQMFAAMNNVWVDVTFQSPGRVRELVRAYGAKRVLFASDWPWGNRKPAVRIVKKACQGDKNLEQKIFCANAAELLKLEPSARG